MNKQVSIINKLYDKCLSAAIAHNERRKLRQFMHQERFLFNDYSKEKEELWFHRWSELGNTDKVFYRYYSRFIGDNLDIIPDDLMHNVIEPVFNPIRYRGLYADKNMFDKLLKPYFKDSITPKTIIRCINGGLYDENYYLINQTDAYDILESVNVSYLVAKPTIDTSSGKNILFFDQQDDLVYYLRNSNKKLDFVLLEKLLGKNYIIQHGLSQSSFTELFNSTSINTFRINTYKSVQAEKAIAINGVLRIGKVGSNVDNLHSGGCMVGIGSGGKLKNYCSDQNGKVFTSFNGIDFSKQEFVVPKYDQVIDFAQKVSSCLPHQRVLALDIMLDRNDQPKLIEYNNCAFSVWVFQQTIGSVFGCYTEEVLDYCREHKKEATRIYLTY